MATVTPTPPLPEPDPARGGGDPAPTGLFDFLKWLLSDHRRAVWVYASLVAVLVATVWTVHVLAPHVGDLGGLLGGLGVGGLGLGGGAAIAQRRRRGDPDEV